MKDLTLVVMAAGMGSRFGGLKQLEPVDDDGNFLLDYSVYDAKKAGFDKVVFVIKEDFFEDFKNTVLKRLAGVIKVSYVFQKIDNVSCDDLSIIKERTKPWGTTQAIYCAREEVPANFAVVNADDFYGYDAYQQIINFFKEKHHNYEYVSVPYPFSKTKSNQGAVKRGVCKIKDGKIEKITECSISDNNGVILATPLSGKPSFTILQDTLVSMNMFGFTHDIFDLLEQQITQYFQHEKAFILNNEILLPDCLEQNLEQNKITLYSRPASSEWLGMTYKEDLALVKEKIKLLKEKGYYPQHLWENKK